MTLSVLLHFVGLWIRFGQSAFILTLGRISLSPMTEASTTILLGTLRLLRNIPGNIVVEFSLFDEVCCHLPNSVIMIEETVICNAASVRTGS